MGRIPVTLLTRATLRAGSDPRTPDQRRRRVPKTAPDCRRDAPGITAVPAPGSGDLFALHGNCRYSPAVPPVRAGLS